MNMREDTKNWLMMLLAFTVGALLALLIVATPHAHAATVCPEAGKVESTVDGDLDDIVLAEGTLVCIKGGIVTVTVTADGEDTLAELLGTGQNVSHYAVLEVPPSTTTTTSVPATTTTTSPGVTPLPTIVSTTTTTEVFFPLPKDPTGGEFEFDSTTTTVTSPTSTRPPSTPDSVSELPYTGAAGLASVIALATVLLAGGLALLRRGASSDS